MSDAARPHELIRILNRDHHIRIKNKRITSQYDFIKQRICSVSTSFSTPNGIRKELHAAGFSLNGPIRHAQHIFRKNRHAHIFLNHFRLVSTIRSPQHQRHTQKNFLISVELNWFYLIFLIYQKYKSKLLSAKDTTFFG